MAKLWQRTLDLIGEDRFDEALGAALDSSPFRPSIADIRRFAGLLTEPRIEREAMDEFRKVIEAIRVFGPRLRPKLGEVISEKDEEGLVRMVPLRAPTTLPPALSDETEATLLSLGFGSRLPGLEFVSRHPALNPPSRDEEENAFRPKLASDIEKRWVVEYLRTKQS